MCVGGGEWVCVGSLGQSPTRNISSFLLKQYTPPRGFGRADAAVRSVDINLWATYDE